MLEQLGHDDGSGWLTTILGLAFGFRKTMQKKGCFCSQHFRHMNRAKDDISLYKRMPLPDEQGVTNQDSLEAQLLQFLGPYDVVCGRNKLAFNNIGNRRFRVTVALNLQRYIDAYGRDDKTSIIKQIVRLVKDENGGRFLELKRNRWVELNEKRCRMKVGHALRDMATARDIQRTQGTSSESIGGQEYVTASSTTAASATVRENPIPGDEQPFHLPPDFMDGFGEFEDDDSDDYDDGLDTMQPTALQRLSKKRRLSERNEPVIGTKTTGLFNEYDSDDRLHLPAPQRYEEPNSGLQNPKQGGSSDDSLDIGALESLYDSTLESAMAFRSLEPRLAEDGMGRQEHVVAQEEARAYQEYRRRSQGSGQPDAYPRKNLKKWS